NNRGGYNSRGGYNQGGYRQRTADYDPNAKYSMKKRIEYKEENFDPNEPIRLNKYLANAGVCSRREADEFILSGAVTVNGEVVKELGSKVLRTDVVLFQEKPVSLEKKVYVLLNKPKDYVTTSDDPQQRKTVMDLVKNACPERIYPVGRLDRNTTGVLLLTNDGDLASKLTHPKFLKKKVYHVYLDKPVTANDLQKISDGIELEDGEIKADAIEYTSPDDLTQVGIEIHSGKNRIVRRIFESLGYRVVKLDRVQFAGLTKKNVRRGDWRFLTEKEVDMLRMGAFE
ncbi:MAG: pseudouridine synthase, partial [Prevotella histicola]